MTAKNYGKNYEKAFHALKVIKSSSYNLSRDEGFCKMYNDMWLAICAAGIKVTPKQALRAFRGPLDGPWTLMQMADYLAQRAK